MFSEVLLYWPVFCLNESLENGGKLKRRVNPMVARAKKIKGKLSLVRLGGRSNLF